jgi:hypothetical protein
MWLLIPVFRRLYRKNESMQRYTAHAGGSLAEAKYLHRQMMQTAEELGYQTADSRAIGMYLQDI